jgi:spermidine/putrescine transport system permease protein
MRGLRLPWLPAYAALFVLLLYLPVLLLPVFSFNDATSPALPLQGFTTRWYAELAANPTVREAAWNSVRVALATSLLATILGICGARAISRYRFRGRRTASAILMAPLVLPEIIMGISLLMVLLSLGVSLSLLTVTLGHVLVCLPYCLVVLTAGFAGFDPSLEEASADLGESDWGTFRRVILPLLMPAVVASLLVSFTISLDEFIIAFFLAGSDPTLPVYIWGQLRFPARLPSVLALGTVLLVISVGLVTLAEVIRRRSARITGNEGGVIG